MKKRFVLFLLVPFFSSCSVMMASNKAGVQIESLQNVWTREELLALGADTLASEMNERGELVETYRILKTKGSIERAFVHGILDLCSGFLWEFAGTPIESALSQKQYYSVKVTYNESEQIQKMELL